MWCCLLLCVILWAAVCVAVLIARRDLVDHLRRCVGVVIFDLIVLRLRIGGDPAAFYRMGNYEKETTT